ncbi:response regulator [Cognatishimia maritima]|uniref:Response regulator receiver domain-containing protein n=1 Tax=Cognatishimia maritima TaxID=870908 RepID=A0A1M5KNL6_9RHOB|nr:response regulator [Cognatishimia maritima]SHG54404.1 Response regulator receiver domain-containing protein [Cognatishimia maritima]
MDEFSGHLTTPTADRPLMGMTVLVVEDSRYASDALRLMCLKSGARIRRADCLASAHRHLRVYRPSVAIIDLGLPDGSGLALIRELNAASPRVEALLAMSGDAHLGPAARAAGADRFLAKPLMSLAAFQQAVLGVLPRDKQPDVLRALPVSKIVPDHIAFLDDLSHAADLLIGTPDRATLSYVAQFLSGVARSAGDTALIRSTDHLLSALYKNKESAPHLALLTTLLSGHLDKREAV